MTNPSIYTTSLENFVPRARSLMEIHPQDDGTDDDNLASSILSNAPKLSAKYNSFGFIPVRNEEVWTIREVPNGEEELYAKGRCVYWTRNSLIVKSFNFTDQVVQVFWTNFNKSNHVCIALVSGLSIFDQIGRHHQILLPFAYKTMHSTNLGLLIERNCDPSDDNSLPVLFALSHPTQEISPIIFKSTTPSNRVCLSYSMASFISIVSCHPTLPYCLMYNSHELQHSIWKIRPTTQDEIDQFGQEPQESTANTFANNQSASCSFRTDMPSHSSLNLSSRQKSSILYQSSRSSIGNFSPRVDFKSRPSMLGNLAASRLGAGCGQMTGDINANATNMRSFNSTHTFNTISTPNRNKIINYLRDNIEEPILPELCLEQVWVESSNKSSRATKFFSVTDLVCNEYVVMVLSASSQIWIMRCDRADKDALVLTQSAQIVGIDAAPMKSMNMMIVIDTSKNFVLYSGLDKVTIVKIHQPIPPTSFRMPHTSSSPASIKHSATEMSPIQASSARKRNNISERSSVGSDLSFQQIFQTLSPVPHASKHEAKTSSPLCSVDARRIEHVIGQTLYVLGSGNQRVKLEIPTICQSNYVRNLLNAMKVTVSKDLGLSITSKWYHNRRSLTQPEIMRAKDEIDLFKSWFMNCLGIEMNIFSDERDFESSLKLTQLTPSKKSRRIRDIEVNPIVTNIHPLFYAMHLVFEDMLVIRLNYDVANNLAELLLVLACILRLTEYQDYYWLKFPCLQDKFGPLRSQLMNLIPRAETLYKPAFFLETPPSVMDFIGKLISLARYTDIDIEEEPITVFPNIIGVTDHSSTIISLFCEMFNIPREKALLNITSNLKSCSMDLSLETRPTRSPEADQKVVELMVSLGKDKDYLSKIPQAINLYLWDALLNCRESPPADWSADCYNLIGRMDLVDLVRGSSKNLDKYVSSEDETLKLLFPDDIRVSDAHRMLASDVPIEFSVVQKQGATEEEHRDDAHRHLFLLNIRTMAMPVGRGAICLRTYSPVIGESFEVPRLDLSGRALSEDRPIEYNHDISVYPWPFFHNGVAAGLTICASTANNIIDSTWINYNRPRSNIPHGADLRDRDLTTANTNNEHAGFLFALGLNGHLEKLSQMALHDYLCQNNDLTKLAILLGMSAAKRGSRETSIIKVLSIHVDALLPPNSTELDVSAPVHAASIIGVGLLYQGSGDSHISRVLLEEIGRLPGPEANSHVDRESYSLSAGLAFGLVNLCRGGSTTISSSDQLRLYMLGGKRKLLTAAQKERYFKQDCHRGEEEYINTHITSPGGTLGLGLMYHRTENESVANWMRAPDTQTLLEYVRPDFLILRMLSFGLIMWKQIEPSEAYINRQMPNIVAQYAFRRNPSPTQTDGMGPAPAVSSFIDYELISQAYCNIIAGCCMAIAMKYAGTADNDAYKTIHKHTKMLIMLSNKPALAEQAGRPCIEACLNVLVTSLAVVMSGTGDLGVMRVCRYLRSRLTQSCVFYGSYMAIHMALGILFLGACRYSLSTSAESIGALVCALYPIYPNHSSDNRYHLQALRHLYVLAAEPRLLIPRDILTKKPVYVNITVTRRGDESCHEELKLRAPCLMPEVDTIEKVYIDDNRYWRIEIKDKSALIKCLFNEHGYLSVKQKAHSSSNQLVRDIKTHILDNMPDGVMKSRKSSALVECVKEDRVVQFSALNQLLTGSHKIDKRFKSLVMEQLGLAVTLSHERDLADKMNLLKPLIGEFVEECRKNDSDRAWLDYVAGKKDWTNSDIHVAYWIVLYGLKCSPTWPADLDPSCFLLLDQ